MSWASALFKSNPEAEALAEEYGSVSRHAAKLQAELDAALQQLSYAKLGNTDVIALQRDRDFWRSEAARLSTECKNEVEYVRVVGESVRAQRAELDNLIAEARTAGFRNGWLHALDDLDDVLSYGVLESRRARAEAWGLDDQYNADLAGDDDIPF